MSPPVASNVSFADEVSGGAANGHADNNAALENQEHETANQFELYDRPCRNAKYACGLLTFAGQHFLQKHKLA